MSRFNTYPNAWDILYFQEIADTKNLSRAAERLGIGQPALSLSLKRLEKNLGTQLVARMNRGLEITEAGQRLLNHSNDLMAKWDKIVDDTTKSENKTVGRYTLGCHASVALYTFPQFLPDLIRTHPNLEFRLEHGLSRFITEQVISGKFDFGIVINPVPHPDLVIHKLGHDEIGFWKSAGNIPDVLIYNPNLLQSEVLLKKISKKKLYRRMITSDSLEIVARLVASGGGHGLLPARVAKSMHQNLIPIHDLPKFTDTVAFVYRSDRTKTSGSKIIIDAIRNVRI
jgi:DNA-binding transcriptional LysR family regulator